MRGLAELLAELLAGELRGLSLYLSSATGLPGEHDNLSVVPNPATLADRMAVGGAIEAATSMAMPK